MRRTDDKSIVAHVFCRDIVPIAASLNTDLCCGVIADLLADGDTAQHHAAVLPGHDAPLVCDGALGKRDTAPLALLLQKLAHGDALTNRGAVCCTLFQKKADVTRRPLIQHCVRQAEPTRHRDRLVLLDESADGKERMPKHLGLYIIQKI